MAAGRSTMARRGWRSAAAVLAVGLLTASACSDDDTDAAPSTSVAPTTTSAASSGSPSTSSASTSTSTASTSSAPTRSAPDESSTGPAELTAAIDKIEAKSQYESTDWGYI